MQPGGTEGAEGLLLRKAGLIFKSYLTGRN